MFDPGASRLVVLGLIADDRTTFKRTPKPSAIVPGTIARANTL